MKRFWAFIKHNRKDYIGVPQLNAHGKHAEIPKEKADLLNDQFECVFTDSTPNAGHNSTFEYPLMDDTNITESGVRKLLESLKATKRPDPTR